MSNYHLFVIVSSLHRFLTDVEIFIHSDVFIGSVSNIYTVVAGIRIARDSNAHNKFKRANCAVFPLGYAGTGLQCEGSAAIKDLWNSNSLGGYRGGTPTLFQSV